jgi:transcriptional regulator with XRE-family HTH domain
MDKLRQKLAPKLRMLRLEKGYTLENMAEMLGLQSASSYGDIEKGKTDIALDRLEEIVKIFEVSVFQLLQIAESPTFNFHFQQGSGFGNHQSNINIYEQRLESIEKKLVEIEKKLATTQN